ncbi:hypothetical protein COEREDRAFT_86994 [Coemansia reversa NRRL 1564]|uniref:DH domain-containing protein n=1 Tax=Coemansia reversa (strain ATCC 12441 / NRRL 1564) TaxID=763665 RepID=A0A2G5BC80_COERN|nr:hypothetical protein COEREDRAFT_86994 [Coemansia reversa NRRL 1564]|eukprot:PIA16613.1 hypothetical protein COEREDRAFT_86994 [Coemansia reversa NRRL 1564]
MADRNALLKQIQKGRTLNKTVTNDRSTPNVGGSSGGGSKPPMAAMGLPRPPIIPLTGNPGGAGKSVSAESQTAPIPMPGFGNLFSKERPKLKHRAGGVDVGRTSEENGSSAAKHTAAEPSEQSSAGQRIANGLRFSLPFRRNSRGRGESQSGSESESFGSKPRAALSPGHNDGSPAIPERRPDSARNWAPPAPSASVSRPASSVSTKRVPPRPPLSSKPQIKPKPVGLVAGRIGSAHSPPAAGAGGSSSLRDQLRPVSSPTQDLPQTFSRTSAEDHNDSGGIIAESQGSVSSLAGMFGQSVRSKNIGHGRTLTGSTFSGPASVPKTPARAPPPPPNSTNSGGASHRRTNSAAAPSQPPPPLPPLSLSPAAKGIPVREGKWTFHPLSDLPPPPLVGKIARHTARSFASYGAMSDGLAGSPLELLTLLLQHSGKCYKPSFQHPVMQKSPLARAPAIEDAPLTPTLQCEDDSADLKSSSARTLADCASYADYSNLALAEPPCGISEEAVVLDLSHNALTRLPQGIGYAFLALHTLDISYNQVAVLPEDIGRLNSLRALYTSNNMLESLPRSIDALQHLEVLDISGNCIASLEPPISRLSVLRILNIGENRLTRLPSFLGLLVKTLQVLLVDGNPFDRAHQALVEPILIKLPKEAIRVTKMAERTMRALTGSNMQNGSASNIITSTGAADALSTPPKPREYMATLRQLVNAGFRRRRRRARDRGTSTPQGAQGFVTSSEHFVSADSVSQRSTYDGLHSPAADALAEPLQDVANVAHVLWRLRDEWDLDPQHSESHIVDKHIAQLRSYDAQTANVRVTNEFHRIVEGKTGSSLRMKILSELLVTEVTYVDTLKNVVGVYLNPMREAKILAESELRKIFSNVEVILAFHNDHFLPAITHALSQPQMAIGNVFLQHSAHFRLYSTYTNSHDTSVHTLAAVLSRRSVSSFLRNARHDVTQIGQVSLDGHLLTPVQRLPRYRMLLTDLLANTPRTHSDYQPLAAALCELNRSICEVNERKRVHENLLLLQRLQEQITGAADIPLIAPHRLLKLVGNFRIQSLCSSIVTKPDAELKRSNSGSVYRYYLFNDMLLQCLSGMNKDMRVSRVYWLRSRLAPADVTHDHRLRIVDAECILYLQGDVESVRRWACEINRRLAD